MLDKLIEQQEEIKAMQENEDSAIKIMKMYEECRKRINKAIEYIENNKEYTTIKKATKTWQYGKVVFEESDEDILNEDMIKELLEILKGENNDKENN